jgi:hypothetical protein
MLPPANPLLSSPGLLRPTFLVSLLLGLLVPTVSTRADDGADLFKTNCIRCHGPQGQGTKRFQRRLEGDRSVEQLAEVIRKTMPEDDPGSLSAEEARALAVHVHGAFYSRLARERNRPARVELARLTVRQYRHAVADLVGSFRWQPKWGEQRGLKAEYFRSRRFNNGDRVLERTDPRVAFDFGTEAPVAGKMVPHEFSIRWNGSLLAPETGEYSFVLRTEHAARLWVNDNRHPLIDAWVKSGTDTEFKGTIFLVAGQVYPLRLEYSKAKQGVDDSAKNKDKIPPVKSSLFLLWKTPHQALEPIPSRQLSPNSSPESYVCSTPFPPDDRSYGWERGTTVSKEWDQAETDAALEAAHYVGSRLTELSGARDSDPQRKEKVRDFCLAFAERAFRRPLTAEQKALIERQLTAARDLELGVKRAVLVTLKSPHFLYREAGTAGKGDDFDVAARLSFGLWDSIPDRDLLDAARSGRLATKDGVRKQAERMLTDVRAAAKLRDFLVLWLKADYGPDLAKDVRQFPGFDANAIADLRNSLEMFLDQVVWSESSDFRELLLSDEVYVNDRLARFFGVPVPPAGTFQKVKLDPSRRAGALTHPYLMTTFSHSTESSPIHRGVFLARGVLGLALRPPPEAVAPLAPALHPNLTTRERVVMQTKPSACMTCHSVINSLGFTLENFDAVGRYRDRDHGKAIDAAGTYQTRDGKTVQLTGARELATFLAGSPEVHAAFTEQLFHHLIQQSVRAYGPNTLEQLRRSFGSNGFHVRKLVVEIMVTAAKPD